MALGNDGPPAQVLTVSPARHRGRRAARRGRGLALVGRGDGITVTFETRYAYVAHDAAGARGRPGRHAGHAKDGPGATFTLSRAPYGDPEDPAGSGGRRGPLHEG